MQDDVYADITSIILDIGINPKSAGFNYLRDACLIHHNKEIADEKFTTEIYPKVSKKYSVSSLVVERGIRQSIFESFQVGGLLAINEIYNALVFDNKKTFSNGEVIAIVGEIIKLKSIRSMLSLN